MKKQVKLYTLFEPHAGKFSNMTVSYSHGTPIYNIAAKSIKQAYWLAGNNVWFDGNVGILETSTNGYGEIKWKDYNGKTTNDSQFGIGGVRSLPKQPSKKDSNTTDSQP